MENSFRTFPIVLLIVLNDRVLADNSTTTGKYDNGILISEPAFITWLLITVIFLAAFVVMVIIRFCERKSLKTKIYVLEQIVEQKNQEIKTMKKKQKVMSTTTTSTEKSMDPMEVTAPGIMDTVDVKDEEEEDKKKKTKGKKEKTETMEYMDTETELDYGRKQKNRTYPRFKSDGPYDDTSDDDKTTTITKTVATKEVSVKKVAPVKKKKRVSNSKKARTTVTATEGTVETADDPLDKSNMRDSTMESIATAELNMISMKAYK